MDFKFDNRAIQAMGRDLVRDATVKMQRELDRLGTRMKGQSIEKVRPAVRNLARSWTSTPSNDLIEHIAKSIAAGDRVILKPQ